MSRLHLAIADPFLLTIIIATRCDPGIGHTFENEDTCVSFVKIEAVRAGKQHFMKPVFDIIAEPKGQTYVDLVNFAASRCDSFSLVWSPQPRWENSAKEMKQALKPFLVSNVRTDEWPGTKLIGGTALVRRYQVSDESVKLLQQAGSLYSWLQPKLPEDLAFYTGQVVWLASISHEHEAWFLEESLSTAEIYAYVPRIKIKPHPRR